MNSKELIEAVWRKAQPVPNNNPNVFRQDYAGAWIRREDFGKGTLYGWAIDHILPKSMGGTDDIDNLIPVQHVNNMMRANRYPRWQTKVTASGNLNEECIRNWYVD